MVKNISVLKETELLGRQFNVYGSIDEPLFKAQDVAQVLEHSNVSDMVSRVDIDEVTKLNLGSLSGETWMLTENGLYEVLMQSRKPIARTFKKAIKQILKEVRINGGYMVARENESPEDLMARALIVAKATLARVEKEKELAQAERDEAIATKAWISDKKTATAMQTASALSKENKKLKIEVDKSKEFATITTVERFTKKRYNWRTLRDYSNLHELDMPKVHDKRYGSVRSYSAEAWLKAYNVDIKKINN